MSLLVPWKWADLLAWATGLEDAKLDDDRMDVDGVIGVDPNAQLDFEEDDAMQDYDHDAETGEEFAPQPEESADIHIRLTSQDSPGYSGWVKNHKEVDYYEVIRIIARHGWDALSVHQLAVAIQWHNQDLQQPRSNRNKSYSRLVKAIASNELRAESVLADALRVTISKWAGEGYAALRDTIASLYDRRYPLEYLNEYALQLQGDGVEDLAESLRVGVEQRFPQEVLADWAPMMQIIFPELKDLAKEPFFMEALEAEETHEATELQDQDGVNDGFEISTKPFAVEGDDWSHDDEDDELYTSDQDDDGDDDDDDSGDDMDEDDDVAAMPLSPEEEDSLGYEVTTELRPTETRRAAQVARANAEWEAQNAEAAREDVHRESTVQFDGIPRYRSAENSPQDGILPSSRRLPAPLRSSLKSYSPKFGTASTNPLRTPRGLHKRRPSTAANVIVPGQLFDINAPVNLNSPFASTPEAPTSPKFTSPEASSPKSYTISPKSHTAGSPRSPSVESPIARSVNSNAATLGSSPRSHSSSPKSPPRGFTSPQYPPASLTPWHQNLNHGQDEYAVSKLRSLSASRPKSPPYAPELSPRGNGSQSRTASLKSSSPSSPYYSARSQLSGGSPPGSRTVSLKATSPRSPGLNHPDSSSTRSRTASLHSTDRPSTPLGPTESFKEVMSRRPPSPHPFRTPLSNRITKPKSTFKDYRVRKVDPLRYKNKLDHPHRLSDTPTKSHLPPSPRRPVAKKRACETCGRAFRVMKKKGRKAATGTKRWSAAAAAAAAAAPVAAAVVEEGPRRSGRARKKTVPFGA